MRVTCVTAGVLHASLPTNVAMLASTVAAALLFAEGLCLLLLFSFLQASDCVTEVQNSLAGLHEAGGDVPSECRAAQPESAEAAAGSLDCRCFTAGHACLHS